MKISVKGLSFTVVVLSAMIALGGCASIIGKGVPQLVTINSNPTDAVLKIEDARTGSTIYLGKTPYTATLARGGGYFKSGKYMVTVEKDGYQTSQFVIDGSPNGWYLGGNLIFGGLIGWLIVDPSTGAMWTLSPESINAELATRTTLLKTGDGLVVVLKDDVPEDLRGMMRPVAAN